MRIVRYWNKLHREVTVTTFLLGTWSSLFWWKVLGGQLKHGGQRMVFKVSSNPDCSLSLGFVVFIMLYCPLIDYLLIYSQTSQFEDIKAV